MELVVEPQRRKDAEMAEPPQRLNEVTRQIVDGAFAVHSTLGPGLLESVYEPCLAYELDKRGLSVARQVVVPICYKELFIEAGFRL
ncbi:MAG TPA: GxxExxY protein, partial [Magnetospirillaceae bacterium]|nr:GxxExxY protein [Magnetospirillaceae bacterium]